MPKRLEVTTPARIESLTFKAVRPMSTIGSIETIKPMISTGKPRVPNTISDAKVAPPPTPATPNDEITIVPIMVNQTIGSDRSIPTVGATMATNMVG